MLPQTRLVFVIMLVNLALMMSFVQMTSVSAEEPSPSPLPEMTTDLPVPQPSVYYRARVTRILDEGEQTILDRSHPFQLVEVTLLAGPAAGTTQTIDHGTNYSIRPEQQVQGGDIVVVEYRPSADPSRAYSIIDRYRLPTLMWFTLLFLILAAAVGRARGVKALLGLVASFAILIGWIVPQLTAGRSPILVSLAGTVAIAVVSLVFAHGRNRRTLVAVIATVCILILATVLANLAVEAAHLLGLGSDEAYQLQFSPFASFDFQGLLLAGIILGTLGVLDDITAGQAAVVDELHQARPELSASELFRRGMSVGREHIASLMNTLVLAYAGASLPLFLYFSLQLDQPLWLIINSQFLAEEIVRTLVGSTTLILAVPIATYLAARVFTRQSAEDQA